MTLPEDRPERPPGSARRPAGASILRLYPASWRVRYEPEMLGVLEQLHLGPRGRLDLVRGALDARLHDPSRVSAAAALGAGGLWTAAGAGILGQPAPPDWPGYLLETLPLAIVATLLGAVAILGCWARQSDGGGRLATPAIVLAIVGHGLWTIALVAAWLGLGYGAVTLAAQSVGAVGTILVGLVLFRARDQEIGAVLVLAPALLLFGWGPALLGFGLGWTIVGALLFRSEPDGRLPLRLA